MENETERTEVQMSGDLIDYITIGLTGVRVWRKGGGRIDVTAKQNDIKKPLTVEFINVPVLEPQS